MLVRKVQMSTSSFNTRKTFIVLLVLGDWLWGFITKIWVGNKMVIKAGHDTLALFYMSNNYDQNAFSTKSDI
jgi:hypothetical protein